MTSAHALHERRILVVEDEYFLAMGLKRDLAAAGAAVLGPAPSVERALAIVAAEPVIDAAVLDINLGGEMAYPIAEALQARRVPFVFVTGYDGDELTSRFADMPRCTKPLKFRKLLDALSLPKRDEHS